MPLILAGGLLPHGVFWGWGSVGRGFLTVFHPFHFIPGVLATVVLHEGLHALGFLLFGRVPMSALHFGFDRVTWSPYAGSRMPMTARSYRGALLLPLVVLGFLPLAWGWFSGVGWMTVLGTLQLLAASGDLVTYRAIRGVPGAVRVADHPQRVGCLVADG